MLRTKIVSTLGPSSEKKEDIKNLITAGMNVARLNFSHGSHEEHRARILALREASRELNSDVAVMLDTKGPEIRIGTFAEGKAVLSQGQTFTLSVKPVTGDDNSVFINYEGITGICSPGDTILLDDGLIELKVIEVTSDFLICEVINGGTLGDRKGVNIPDKSLPLPSLTDKDKKDLLFAVEMDMEFVAASFIRKASDVYDIRRFLAENGGDEINIIAKVENREGVENIEEIISASDGVMVARGDLGVEIPVEEVPLVQKLIIEKCNAAGKPVITATQMLDSMIRNPRPTRAETSDVANAIFDGTDAIMLSGETAAGKYPVETVQMMARIAQRAEQSLMNYQKLKTPDEITTVTDAICHATCSIARDLKVKAIITSTKSGYSAKAVTKFNPGVPVIAVTPYEKVVKTLQLVRNVIPLKVDYTTSIDDMLETAVQAALDSNIVKKGDVVVITAGVPVNTGGTTNLIRVKVIADIILRGIGIGHDPVSGIVYLADTPQQAMVMPGDSIIVVKNTDDTYMPALKRAKAILAEEGDLASHAAITAVALQIPIIVGAYGATKILRTGNSITIDPLRGRVLNGIVDVKP